MPAAYELSHGHARKTAAASSTRLQTGRRRILTAAAAFSVWLLASGHTPYRQWAVYRQKHLLIGANKADPATYELGKKIARLLAEEVPSSRARVARAPHAWRLASLLTTDQIQVVLLSDDDVQALRDGRDGFEAFAGTELRALYRFGSYWLICRPDFPGAHAGILTAALADHGPALAKLQGVADEDAPVPIHAGIHTR
ncbi:MAG: hypothetical protein ACR2Q4_12765 [Geminicoccaceae bacterium]